MLVVSNLVKSPQPHALTSRLYITLSIENSTLTSKFLGPN